jgi:hypothetical protein
MERLHHGHLCALLEIHFIDIPAKAGTQKITKIDSRFGFGILRRSTTYIPVGVRGNDGFLEVHL